MPDPPLLIKRYPNRRFYSSHAKAYVTLEDIERLIREGHQVEIRDNQTGADLTRLVLTEMLIERHPDKVALFPADLLHFMLRANDLMADFLRNYFRDSLTYLEYLQTQGAAAPLSQPMHWMRSWLDNLAQSAQGFRPPMAAWPQHPPTAKGEGPGDRGEGPGDRGQGPGDRGQGPGDRGEGTGGEGTGSEEPGLDTRSEEARAEQLARQVAELEERIRRLEAERVGGPVENSEPPTTTGSPATGSPRTGSPRTGSEEPGGT